MMKLMARQISNTRWETEGTTEWHEVKEGYDFFPSGRQEIVIFPNGRRIKAKFCEVCYVF